jgi:hypothetical protein
MGPFIEAALESSALNISACTARVAVILKPSRAGQTCIESTSDCMEACKDDNKRTHYEKISEGTRHVPVQPK